MQVQDKLPVNSDIQVKERLGMSIFIIIVLTALVLKGTVLWIARKVPGEMKIFLGLVLMFSLHNLCELLIYLGPLQANTSDMLLRAYYVLCSMVVTWMCLYSIHVAAFKSDLASRIVLSTGVVVSLIFLFTDMVVVGATVLGAGVTALKGPYYFVFQVTMITGFVFVITSLALSWRNSDSHLVKTRCSLVLLALMPIMVAATAVILLMQFDVKVNAAGLIPIATTIFLVVILRMERSHKLTDMRMLIPGSEESKVLGELMAAFSNYSIYGENHKETLNEIERALVIYKHTAMANMKTSEIAKEMGMPRPTLYSIYNRLGLKDSIRDVLKRPEG